MGIVSVTRFGIRSAAPQNETHCPMSSVPNLHPDAQALTTDASFDPVRERERILESLRGKALDPQQAEVICGMLALLAEA